MRDLDTVDFELRLLAAVRRSIREHGGQPSSHHVDELLDERNRADRKVSALKIWKLRSRVAGSGRHTAVRFITAIVITGL
jgi:hypothetical protein